MTHLNEIEHCANWLLTDPPVAEQDKAVDYLIAQYGPSRGLQVWSAGMAAAQARESR